jgi:hypothetical protein
MMYKYLTFIIIIFRRHFSKIKNSDLENSKHIKFCISQSFNIIFFNEDDKSKFEDQLMYFLSFFAPKDSFVCVWRLCS